MPSAESVERANRQTMERLRHDKNVSHSSWHGTAFLIEALLLVAILAGSIAVFMQLFAQSHVIGTENALLASAVQLAADDAEAFAADPTQSSTTVGDGLVVSRSVETEDTGSGTLYNATITVRASDDDAAEDALYTLQTSRYVSRVS